VLHDRRLGSPHIQMSTEIGEHAGHQLIAVVRARRRAYNDTPESKMKCRPLRYACGTARDARIPSHGRARRAARLGERSRLRAPLDLDDAEYAGRATSRQAAFGGGGGADGGRAPRRPGSRCSGSPWAPCPARERAQSARRRPEAGSAGEEDEDEREAQAGPSGDGQEEAEEEGALPGRGAAADAAGTSAEAGARQRPRPPQRACPPGTPLRSFVRRRTVSHALLKLASCFFAPTRPTSTPVLARMCLQCFSDSALRKEARRAGPRAGWRQRCWRPQPVLSKLSQCSARASDPNPTARRQAARATRWRRWRRSLRRRRRRTPRRWARCASAPRASVRAAWRCATSAPSGRPCWRCASCCSAACRRAGGTRAAAGLGSVAASKRKRECGAACVALQCRCVADVRQLFLHDTTSMGASRGVVHVVISLSSPAPHSWQWWCSCSYRPHTS